MASVTPRTIDEIKVNLLNPALTSHFHVSIGRPFNEEDFSSFLEDAGCNFKQDQLNLQCCEASLPGSQLATSEIINDFPGVTERHVYRRQFDDRIDLNFYCDAEQYLPIRFFEGWIKYITNEKSDESRKENYSYRMKFPNTYKGPLEVTKFEKNINSKQSVKPLTYRFVNAFPLSISSMPVTYDSSDLLKCNVSFAYSRYYIDTGTTVAEFTNPSAQANYNNVANGFNIGGVLTSAAQKAGNQGAVIGRRILNFFR
tara:strand:- start:941 stop:1708 length:768 start_codon:yes stop_codon:yes gene_type:complete